MAQYGEVRVDYITYTTGTTPAAANATVTVSSLVNNPNFSGDVNIEGGAIIEGNLNVSGNSVFDTIVVSGNSTLNDLGVSGTSNLNDLNVTGNTNLNSLTVTGTTVLDGLVVSGNATVSGDLTVEGNIDADGVTISGFTGIFTSGSASNPSITFVDDLDTGFYHPSGNNIFSVTNAGTTTATFGSTGLNISQYQTAAQSQLELRKDNIITWSGDADNGQQVGTNTVLLRNLAGEPDTFSQIVFEQSVSGNGRSLARIAGIRTSTGTISTTELAFTTEENNVKRETMRIAGARVGINTPNPVTALEIQATNNDGIYLIDSSSSFVAPALKIEGKRSDNNGNDAFGAKVLLEGIRVNENVKSNKSLGIMAFGGNYASGQADITYSAGVRGRADGNFTTASGIPTRLEFLTTPDGNTGWNPIDSVGSPGIVRYVITSEGRNLFNLSPGSSEQSVALAGSLQIFPSTSGLQDRTNYWGYNGNIATNEAAIHMPYGYLGTQGAFRLSLYCNGYRTSSGTFEYLDIDGHTNTAAGIDLDPEGYIQFRTGTASGTVLPVVASIYSSGLLVGPGNNPTARLTVNDADNVSDFYDTTIDTSIFVIGGDATPAQYEKGASIGFSRLNSSNRMGAAIAARQSGADSDQMGLNIYTHASTNTGANLNEVLRIDHDGRVTIGNNLANNANAAGHKVHVEDNVLGTTLYDKKLFTRFRSTTSNGDTCNLLLSRELTTSINWTTATWATQRLVDSTYLTSYGFSHKDTSGSSFFVGFNSDPIVKDMEIWRPASATAANVVFNQNTDDQRRSTQDGPRYEFWSGLSTPATQNAPSGATYTLVTHGGSDGLKQVGIGSYDNKASIQAFGSGTNFNLYINPSNGVTSFNRSNRCATTFGPTDGNNNAHVYVYGGAPASGVDGKYTVGVNGGIKIRDNSGTSSAPGLVIIGQRNDANGSASFAGKIGIARLRGDSRLTNNMSCGAVNFGCNHTDATEGNILYAAAIEARTEGESVSASNMPIALLFRTGIAGQDLDTPNVNVGAERMRIRSDGVVQIASQILFGGNTSTDDRFDYDTGTFTLHLAASNQPNGSIASTTGHYVRNGKVITYSATLLANSVNIGSNTGNLILRGFPVNGFTGRVSQSFPIAYNGSFGDFATQWDFPAATPYFWVCDDPSGGGNKIPVSSISGQNVRYYFTFSLALID